MKVLQKLIIILVKFVSLHIFEKPILLSFSMKVNSWDEVFDNDWAKLLECLRLLGGFKLSNKTDWESIYIIKQVWAGCALSCLLISTN